MNLRGAWRNAMSRCRAWGAAVFRRWFPARTLGQQGEALAAKFLRRRGYIIVGRSERDRLGELDLVAVDQRTVVFVEVKTRRGDSAGLPQEAVDAEKQRRLARAAAGYLKRHGLLEHAARFDVVAITWPEGGSRPTIELIQNAFEPPGRGQMFS